MFIEFETVTDGHMMLNLKHIVRVKRHVSDSKTEIILANGDSVYRLSAVPGRVLAPCGLRLQAAAARIAMSDLDSSALTKLFAEFGHRIALRGGNPYRARAYGPAAENLLALTTPLSDLIDQDSLRGIPGGLADIIRRLPTTGSHPVILRELQG